MVQVQNKVVVICTGQAVSAEWKRDRVLSRGVLRLALRLAFRNGDNGQLEAVCVLGVRFAVTGDNAIAPDSVVVFRGEGYVTAKDGAPFRVSDGIPALDDLLSGEGV